MNLHNYSGRIASSLCAATVTTGVVLVSPILVPPAIAQGCPDIEVVFARGTNDAPGVGATGQAFIDSLRSKVGGRSVGQYAVNYAALTTFLASTHAGYVTGQMIACDGGYLRGI